MNYNTNEKCLIYLSCFQFLTYEKLDKLIYLCETPEKLIHKLIDKKYEILKILSLEEYERILKYLDDDVLKAYLKKLEDANIKCVTYYSDNYPEKLKHIDKPPYILYCKGDLSLLNSPSIAIVGSRKPTSYGEIITKQFTEGLVDNGLTIVSGLAYGVDKIANEVAVSRGKTIAVLGGGFNQIYPKINTDLASKIAEKGLLVSEYHIDTKPQSYHFISRNRIIAGLCDAVLITEAAEKSGSMHTKEFALDVGKDVFAVPGNINSENSKGTNKLIKCTQAHIATTYTDILDRLNIKPKQIKTVVDKKTDNEQLIVNALKNGERHFEELLLITKLDTKTLNTCLTTLTIRGIIKKLTGNYYIIL